MEDQDDELEREEERLGQEQDRVRRQQEFLRREEDRLRQEAERVKALRKKLKEERKPGVPELMFSRLIPGAARANVRSFVCTRNRDHKRIVWLHCL